MLYRTDVESFGRLFASQTPLTSVTESHYLVSDCDGDENTNTAMFVHLIFNKRRRIVRLQLGEWVAALADGPDGHILKAVKLVKNTTEQVTIRIVPLLGTAALEGKNKIEDLSVEDILFMFERYLSGEITIPKEFEL